MYELIHRADSFTAMQDGAIRVATRGDLVMGSFDVLDRLQVAARVTAVIGNLVELDEEVTGKAGLDYALRFRTGVTSANTIGTSTVRPVAVSTTPGRAVRLTGAGAVPRIGDTVHFGPSTKESIALRVRGIEAGEDFSAKLLMVAAAPQIDDLTDAEVPPVWDGRVGEIVSLAEIAPATPSITAITSASTPSDSIIEILLRSGRGSAAAVTSFEVDHRPTGGSWTTRTIPVAEGAAHIEGYAYGTAVEIRARSIASGLASDDTSTVTYVVGSGDAAIPPALDDNGITIVGGYGNTAITFVTGADTTTALVQLYRVPAGEVLDREAHRAGAPIDTKPRTTFNYNDGDRTRSNLLKDAEFNSGSPWAIGAGWAVTGGKAAHAPGEAGLIEQSLSLAAGAVYRIGTSVSVLTDGELTAQLRGGTNVSGSTISTGGLQLDTLTAVAGNDTFTLSGDIDLDAAIGRVVLYRETAACLDQGTFAYFLEPQSAKGLAGPLSGPFSTTVI